jgi:hypothetical protein
MSEVVLTSFTNTDNSNYLYFGNSGYSTITPHAQGFQIQNSGLITSIEVKIINIPSTKPDWIVSIQTDDSGKPSGNLINVNATKTIAGPSATGITKITFDNSFSFSADTQYWLVLHQSDPVFGHVWGMSYNSNDEYSYGAFLYSTNGGVSWNDSGGDYYFVIYGESSSVTKISKVAGVSQAKIKTVYPTALSNIKKISEITNS